jgi:hypothetical protein
VLLKGTPNRHGAAHVRYSVVRPATQ